METFEKSVKTLTVTDIKIGIANFVSNRLSVTVNDDRL